MKRLLIQHLMLAHRQSRPHHQFRHRGFTLIELVLVLVVLAAVAGMLVSQMDTFLSDDAELSPKTVATRSTMRMIRNAIMGEGGKPGALADLGQHRDELDDLNDLLLDPAEFTTKHADVQPYDPISKTGWRGPYLSVPGSTITDAWGNAFEITGLLNDEPNIVLRSAGPDLNFNSIDDLTLVLRGAQP